MEIGYAELETELMKVSNIPLEIIDHKLFVKLKGKKSSKFIEVSVDQMKQIERILYGNYGKSH